MTSQGSDYIWRRPDVWAGAALSGAAATASFGPSLMPRSTTHQAILAGASGTVGWVVGSTAYSIAARTGHAGIDTAILGSIGAAGMATRFLIPWHEHEPRWRPPIRSAAEVVGAGALSAATVAAVKDSRSRTAFGIAVGAAATTAAVLRIRSSVNQQEAARDEYDRAAPVPARAVAEGLGVLGVLGALIGGYRISGGAVARRLEQRLGVPHTPARVAGNVIATGLWALGTRVLAGSVVTGLARYDRVLDPGYDIPPTAPTRSGSAESHVPWSRLGRQGRRFITDSPSASEIERVMGKPAAAEPIRIFVGYDSAKTAESRVALAVDELDRTGALDRGLLVVSCPAGTGYVNTLPMEVAEFATLGDCASVAVQYARLPSLLAIQNTKSGAKHHRLLLQAIKDKLDQRDHLHRPTVVVYGESLGSWAGQDAFIDGGIEGLDHLGVDRALWVGTPHYSKWRRQALKEGAVPEGTVEEVNAFEDLDSDVRRVTLLTHFNDPVNKLNASMFYREPSWLMESPSKPGVASDQMWVPVVTALQSVVDTVNATNPTPGLFRATGHDYRLDLPRVTVATYGLPDPSHEQWTRLMDHLQAEEKRRHEAMQLGDKPLREEEQE